MYIFSLRPKCPQKTMLLTFYIFWRTRNHCKKFPELNQTSFSRIVYSAQRLMLTSSFYLWVKSFKSITLCLFSRTLISQNGMILSAISGKHLLSLARPNKRKVFVLLQYLPSIIHIGEKKKNKLQAFQDDR